MDFIKQYFKIVNYTLMGLVFGFASFYLLANAYHYLEIRKDFVTDFNSQPLVLSIEEKLNKVTENTSNFNSNDYHGKVSVSKMQLIQSNLRSCVNSIRNSEYEDMKNKDKITVLDVYKLRESYENTVLSNCIVNGLYWTTTIDKDFGSKYLLNNKDMLQLYVNSLLNETSYLKKDLLNNSSYFFNTSIVSASVKDTTRDGFYEVMSAYNKAASYVEFISDWFKNNVEGNYD